MLNGLIAALIGVYLIMVAWGNQQSALFGLIREQTGFLKWLGAIITLAFLYNTLPRQEAELLRALAWLAFVALMIGYGERIIPQFTKLFAMGEQDNIRFSRRLQK